MDVPISDTPRATSNPSAIGDGEDLSGRTVWDGGAVGAGYCIGGAPGAVVGQTSVVNGPHDR